MLEFKEEPFLNHSYFTSNIIQVFEEKQKEKATKSKPKMLKIKKKCHVWWDDRKSNKQDWCKNLTTRKIYLKWSFIPTFKSKKQFCNGAMAIKKEKCIK